MLGSARASRADDRALAIANFHILVSSERAKLQVDSCPHVLVLASLC